MSIIRIFANGLELDIVKETLTIKKENNAFIQDLKVAHSSYPFLVIENERTKAVLGARDITSINKKIIAEVVVIEMGERYYGELQVTNYLNGYRKCNVKYGTDLLKILGKKLDELLPVVSVIPGETEPVPFTESAFAPVSGYDHWEEYPIPFAGKIYPEVKYQFPQMAWYNKFWDEQPEDTEDEWYHYDRFYNKFNLSPLYFLDNSYDIDGDFGQEISVINQQVPSPQLFLLGILEYGFAALGYSITGTFVENAFIRRLLVLSLKDNLCKVVITPEEQVITFADFTFQGNINVVYDYYEWTMVPDAAGTYTFKYNIQEPLRTGSVSNNNIHSRLVNVFDGVGAEVYSNTNDSDNLLFEGEFTINVDAEQVGETIRVRWLLHVGSSGLPASFDIRWGNAAKTFNMMHPTIPLGRYAPEWTLGEFVNEVKKLFCLDIRFDNLAKKVWFNYASALVTNPAKHVALKSLAVTDYDPPANTGFVLKYANDTDTFLYIDKTGLTLNKNVDSDLVTLIQSKFKQVPHTGFTADLAAAVDKDGVGLMIYAPEDSEDFRLPVIANSYEGHTLELYGPLGIYTLNWKNVLHFRLNASRLEISGPFSEVEITQLNNLQKIYIDNQEYVVLQLEFKPTRQGNYLVRMQLESVNF